MKNIKNIIDDVFSKEIKALEEQKNISVKAISEAVKLIGKIDGNVITTGIGKSGHIAKKISATLSSTGTKSIFIHPVEGTHGDLGIVDDNDCVVCISKSGETEELLLLLPFFKRNNIPIITITANPNSKLAEKSDVIIPLSTQKEACPLNLAPTTSTTLSLVIGDALAVSLMSCKDFKKEHFAMYHPAGQLGKRLLFKVSDIMVSGDDNALVDMSADFRKVIEIITEKALGACSVINDDGKFVGLITDYDIRTNIDEDLSCKKAQDIMNPDPTFVYEHTMAVDALNIMEDRDRPFNVLPVLNDAHRPTGLVRLHDLVRAGLR